jgi:hypothetical protein
MNLYIIGNGFDLDLGYDTSYKSFIESVEFKGLCNEQSNNQLAKHINHVFKEENHSLWVDLEETLGVYANEFSKEDEYEFILSLNDLKFRLKNYLQRQKSNKPNQESTRAFSFLKLIEDDLNKNRKAVIIDFNYTNRVMKKLSLLFSGRQLDMTLINYIQPHGDLGSEIVLGVNEDFLKETGHKYSFIKKGYSNSFNLSNWKNTFTEANSIRIFGHSLGITDSDVFAPMFDHYLKTPTKEISIEIYDRPEANLDIMKKIDLFVAGKINTFRLQHKLSINQSF